MATAVDHFSDEEKTFINRLAVYLEIDPYMVQKVIESPEQFKADHSAKKNILEIIYDLSKMILADNIVDNNEKKMLKKMIICLGFDSDKSSQVIETAL